MTHTAFLDLGNPIPSRLNKTITEYVLALISTDARGGFTQAAHVGSRHKSSYSRALNNKRADSFCSSALNRKAGRAINSAHEKQKQCALIVDATFISRHGKDVENKTFFKQGNAKFHGHKFINFVFVVGELKIPVASIPWLSRDYCDENALAFRTETEIVTDFLLELPLGDLLPKEFDYSKLICLFDSGYDKKDVQKTVSFIGAKFVMAIKSNRCIGGRNARDFFRDLSLNSTNIQIKQSGSGKRKEQKTALVKIATGVRLKGFGEVTAVHSKLNRAGKKDAEKFLVTDDLSMSAEDILKWYAQRWAIETLHRTWKQKFGYGKCKSQKFKVVVAHVNLVLVAFLESFLNKELSTVQAVDVGISAEKLAKGVMARLTRFNGVNEVKHYINEVLQPTKS